MTDKRNLQYDHHTQSSWVDRHLGKIVGVVFTLCLIGLIIRALAG